MNNRIQTKCVLATLVIILLFTYSAVANKTNVDTIRTENSSTVNRNHKKNILVINAYHNGFHWTDSIMAGIKVVFSKYDNIELFTNYMDAKRCSDSTYFDQLKNIYKYKYQHVDIDAILATDDHALDFLIKYRDEIKPNVPVVFCGINDFKPSRIAKSTLFTGVHESYDIEGTINLILSLHPSTKQVVVISDATVSGKAFDDRMIRVAPAFKNKLEFKYLKNKTPKQICKQLQNITHETIVLWSIYIRKPDGSVLSSKESIRFISECTSQPIYCIWDVVGQGVVGGKITNPVYQGTRSAELILDVLSGKSLTDIPVEGSPLVYKFDSRFLEKFNISEDLLPTNSIIINKSSSIYQLHKHKIIGIGIFILFLIVVVIVLFYLVQKQKQSRIEVSVKNKKLEKAGLILKENNIKLSEALEIAKRSTELEKANKKLKENEKIQQKLNDELRVSNLTKDKFFAIIAHDLRSPFNSMLGISAILQQEFDNYNIEKQKRFLSMIDSTMQSTYNLLENLLLWSRSQRGDIGFNVEQLDVYYLVNESIELLWQLGRNKGLTLQNKIPEHMNVKANKEMLSTVIRNLLSNAIKFTECGGEIVLNAELVNDKVGSNKMVEISVSDTGVGIPQDKQSKIFDIDENNSTKGTGNEEGSGLGLILCKEFVEKHQGSIWVKSELGKGSTFTFTIPYSESSAKKAQ